MTSIIRTNCVFQQKKKISWATPAASLKICLFLVRFIDEKEELQAHLVYLLILFSNCIGKSVASLLLFRLKLKQSERHTKFLEHFDFLILWTINKN